MMVRILAAGFVSVSRRRAVLYAFVVGKRGWQFGTLGSTLSNLCTLGVLGGSEIVPARLVSFGGRTRGMNLP